MGSCEEAGGPAEAGELARRGQLWQAAALLPLPLARAVPKPLPSGKLTLQKLSAEN